jgi:hypothetical protein
MLRKRRKVNSGSMSENQSFKQKFERTILLEKIHIGLSQSKCGKVVSMDDAKERLKKMAQVVFTVQALSDIIPL